MHDQCTSRHLGCRFQRIILRQQRLPFSPHINARFFEQTPYTGFEPASLLQPTIFKTAPSPPGHTANIAVQWNCYIPKLLFPPLCTISCGLSTAYGKVHPCRKLTQCVGLEPTRRINARPDSNRLQFHYGNTAKFSTYRQRTFVVLFPRFLSRQRFHHKKNIIHYTKTRQPCHINNILQRVGIAGIEPATTRI